jgi:hypothetical protein
MNGLECQELVDNYVDWLRDRLKVDQIGDICELTTPFLDRHNDHLQVYAVPRGNRILLTDDGETIGDLAASGVDVTKGRRRELLETTLRGFGVNHRNGQLEVEATKSNIGQRTHSLIQSMLAVNDLYMLSRSRVASLFWEDVRDFLEQNEIRFTPRVKITGKSGYDHSIDFVIPSSKEQPERLLQAITTPDRTHISNFLFTAEDTRSVRPTGSVAMAVLNDTIHEVADETATALDAYEISTTRWSQREEMLPALVG